MMNNLTSRFGLYKDLLKSSKYFKLVCGAGNEDAEEVEDVDQRMPPGNLKLPDDSACLSKHQELPERDRYLNRSRQSLLAVLRDGSAIDHTHCHHEHKQ